MFSQPRIDLHAAARSGEIEQIRKLLKAGANPRARDEYTCTPIHQAAWYGNIDAVLEFLKHDKSLIDEKTYRGYTAISQVVASDYCEEQVKTNFIVSLLFAGCSSEHSQITCIETLMEKSNYYCAVIDAACQLLSLEKDEFESHLRGDFYIFELPLPACYSAYKKAFVKADIVDNFLASRPSAGPPI